MKLYKYLTILCLVATSTQSATIPGSMLGHFEGTEGTVVTPTVLTNVFAGSRYGAFQTVNDPSAQTDGPIPHTILTTLANFPLFTPASINGIPQNPASARGIKFNMGQNEACQFTIPSPGLPVSVGFYMYWAGGNVNFSPRDVFSLRVDPTGAYQFLQLYDQGPTRFHAHWQPGGTGIGNDVTISKNHWYWFTMKSVLGGNTFTISCYDAQNNYALVGTSTGAYTGSATQRITTIQFGMIQYGDPTESGQDLYFDNIIVNTNNVFPLGPGGGPLIAGTNSVDWTLAGMTIPTVTTVFTNFSNGATLNQIQNAANIGPSNQVIFLNDGTYQFGTTGLQLKSGQVLRGNSFSNTVIAGAVTTTASGIITVASEWLSGNAKTIPLRSGYTQGSSNLVLNAVDASLHPNYIITIDQLNDGTLVYNNSGEPGENPGGGPRTDITPEGDGLRCLSQTCKVISISNNTNIVIWPPLYWTYTAGLSPQIYYRPSSSANINYATRVGIENLCVSNYDVNGNGIAFNRAANCWVQNVQLKNGGNYHIVAFRSYGLEIFNNLINGTIHTGSSGGYGIVMEYQTGASRIENNIIYGNRDFVQVNSGSSGNVFFGNYQTNAIADTSVPTFTVHGGGTHSAHPMMNLFEANDGYSPIFDFYWGSASHNTILRNRWRSLMPYSSQLGRAIAIDATNSYFQVVGNILGYSNITANANFTQYIPLSVSPTAIDYGNTYSTIRIGYWSDGDVGGGGNASTLFQTHTINGNFDFVLGVQTNMNPSTAEWIPPSLAYPNGFPSWASGFAQPWIDPSTANHGAYQDTNSPAGARWASLVASSPVADPVITANPVAANVLSGQNVTFTVTATGGTTLHYQWKKNGSNIGTDSSGVSFATVNTDNQASILVTVSDVNGSLDSTPVILTVVTNSIMYAYQGSMNFGITPTNVPVNSTITISNAGAGTLSGSASISAPYTVTANGTYNLTSGQTQTITVTYTPTLNQQDNGTVVFTGGGGTNITTTGIGYYVYSPGFIPMAAATLISPMQIDVQGSIYQPNTTLATVGGRALIGVNISSPITSLTLSGNVIATNTANNTLAIDFDSDPIAPSQEWSITNLTANVLTLRTVSKRGVGSGTLPQFPTNTWSLSAGIHLIEIRGIESYTLLNQLLINATNDPNITVQPQGTTITSGQNATFNVTASGNTTLHYQWKFNGVNVGSDSSSYTRSNCQVADDSGIIMVIVSDASGSVNSQNATLNVNAQVINYGITIQGKFKVSGKAKLNQ